MSNQEYYYCYKYLPFDDGSRKVITEGTIKYTCPLDFNDPFDCAPCYSESSLNNVGTTKRELISRIGKAKGWSPAKRIQNKRKVAAQLKSFIGSEKHKNSMLTQVGVLCLSRDPTSVLMWSHYAEFHKGFVVEFKIPVSGYREDALKPGINLIPFPITYSSDRPVIEYGKESDQETIDKALLTKFEAWSYEEEMRVIEHERGPGIHTYVRDERLNAVIAGMKMSEANVHLLQSDVETVNDNPRLSHVKLYNARPSATEYSIEIPGLK